METSTVSQDAAPVTGEPNCKLSLVIIPKAPGNACRLRHFFLHGFCPSRTLLKTNPYSESLAISLKSDAVNSALKSLCALYLGDRQQFLAQRSLAIKGCSRVVIIGTSESTLKIILQCTLLLLQASILDPELHNDWVQHLSGLSSPICQAKGFPQTLQLRIKIASHAILANASATLEGFLPQYEFLAAEEQEIDRIDALTGLSPKLLRILQSSNALVLSSETPERKRNCAFQLLDSLNSLQQVVEEDDVNASSRQGDAQFCISVTAETYRLAAILYVQSRILGSLASDQSLAKCQDELLGLLENLPCDGEHYKAIWPLYPLFILSVVYGTEKRRQRLSLIWEKQARVSLRSNIEPAVHAAKKLLTEREDLDWESAIRPCGLVSLT
ncbi:fungal-specific transcription factor domain-containing protein [Chaetomium sp. MPI-SDFR-AT-0129]|nr:fungal-specific transcription factor domain-containing protein [Chaetomium sp. MPI-SDFR-AT-0129]